MNADEYDELSALAHQMELECWQQMLETDPAYDEWLKQIDKERHDEIPRKTLQ